MRIGKRLIRHFQYSGAIEQNVLMEDPLLEWTDVSGPGGFGRLLSIITGKTIAEIITKGQTPEIILLSSELVLPFSTFLS